MGNYSLNKRLFSLAMLFFLLHQGLATQLCYEENAKKVNDIFLSTVAKGIDIFTTQQASELYDIANQCPLAGGEAVYQARAMYSLIDEDAYYLDKELCILPGNNWRKSETKNIEKVFELYPNPAQNTVTLYYPTIKQDVNTLYIYDALGKIVNASVLEANVNEHIINIRHLTGGVYYYKMLHNETDTFSGKLVIVK